MCKMFYCLWVSIDAQALLCLTVGLVQSVPAVAGRSTPAIGYGEPEAMPTIWPASPASPANGSCPQARSSGWLRRKYFVGSITTQWWRTWNGLLRAVRVSDAFHFVLLIWKVFLTTFPGFLRRKRTHSWGGGAVRTGQSTKTSQKSTNVLHCRTAAGKMIKHNEEAKPSLWLCFCLVYIHISVPFTVSNTWKSIYVAR